VFLVVSYSVQAQKNLSSFRGNIKVLDTTLSKVINGFYSYLQDEGHGKQFNSAEYFVGITLSRTNDSTDYIEVTLSNYALSRPIIKTLPGFYGFLKRNSVYFLFWNKNRLVKRSIKTPNPNIFKKFKRPRIVAPYDPYAWEFVLCKGKILKSSPVETISKYAW
jgi:hypothetical protein